MIRYTPAFATATASSISSNNPNSGISSSSSHYQVLQQLYAGKEHSTGKITTFNSNYNNYGYCDALFQQEVDYNSSNKSDNAVEYYNFYDNTGYQYSQHQYSPKTFTNDKNLSSGFNSSSDIASTMNNQPHSAMSKFANNNIQSNGKHPHVTYPHNHNPYLNNSSNVNTSSFKNKNKSSGSNKKILKNMDNYEKCGSKNNYDTYRSFTKLSRKCFDSLKNNTTTTRHISAIDINNMIQFIEMYKNMRESSSINPLKQQDIVYLLRIILELHRNVRFNLLKLKRKPDYDDQSIYKNLINILFQLLEMINNDLLAGDILVNVKIDQSIIGTLINCYKDFEMIENALKIWKNGVFEQNSSNTKNMSSEFNKELFTPKNTENQRIFLNPGVIGSILPILQNIGNLSLTKILKIYNESKKLALLNTNSKGLDTLNLGMIQVYLDNDMVDDALLLYHENLKMCSLDYNTNNYWKISISEIQFISKCRKIDIAMRFFEKLINQEYNINKSKHNTNGSKNNLQASHVNLFMMNIWEIDQDLEKVVYVWNKVLNYYGSNVYPGVISSLNDTFFKIFFEFYSLNPSNELKLQGFVRLTELINQNAVNIKNNKIENNEVFFNILLTHSSKNWKDFNIYKYLIKCYQTYCDFQLITIVPYRISLKSLGYIKNTPVKVIRDTWIQLLNKLKKNGKLSYISNPDFAALRDATLGWCKNECIPEILSLNKKIEILKKQQIDNVQNLIDSRSKTPIQFDLEESYNPAIEALQSSGAFDLDLLTSKFENQEDDLKNIEQVECLNESLSELTLNGLLYANEKSSNAGSMELSELNCENSNVSSSNNSSFVIGNMISEKHIDNSLSSMELSDPLSNDIKNLEKKISDLTEEKESRIKLYWDLYNENKSYCRDLKQQYDYLVLNVLKNFNCLEPTLSVLYNENLDF
ncbi:hypothetical protein QEN19_000382 [Hanseniaspora menglaensis]